MSNKTLIFAPSKTIKIMSLKEKYWQNGNLLLTKGNGFVIVCNNLAFALNGSFPKSELDKDLKSTCWISGNRRVDACDIEKVYTVLGSRGFNPYSAEEVEKNAKLVWSRDAKQESNQQTKKTESSSTVNEKRQLVKI